MTSLITSEEYRVISADAFSNIFSFLSYQHSQQVSRVSQDALIASQISREKADRAARVIQRGFRRWKVKLSLARTLWNKDYGQLVQFLRTIMGKKFGKSLFTSFYFKFFNRIRDNAVISYIFHMFTLELEYHTNLDLEDFARMEEIKKEFNSLEWNPEISDELLLTKKCLWKLINQVFFSHMEKNGYQMVYNTRIIFGERAPHIWDNYTDVEWLPVAVDFVDSDSDPDYSDPYY